MAQEPRIFSAAEEQRVGIGRLDSSQPVEIPIGHKIPRNTGIQQPPMAVSNEQLESSQPGNSNLETLSRPEPELLRPWNMQDTGSQRPPHSPIPNAPSVINASPPTRVMEQPQDLPGRHLQILPKSQFLSTLNSGVLNSHEPTVASISSLPSIEAPNFSWKATQNQQYPSPSLETGLGLEQAASQSLQPIDSEGGKLDQATDPFGSALSHWGKIAEEDTKPMEQAGDPSSIFQGHEEEVTEEDANLRDEQEVVATHSEETLPSLDRFNRGESPSTDSLSTLPSDGFDENPFAFHQAEEEAEIEFERDSGSGDILRLKPTLRQWKDFPSLLAFARSHNAELDGCFKIVLPDGALEALPEKPAQVVDANAFTPQLLRPSRIWRVNTKPTTGKFPSTSDIKESKFSGDASEAAKRLSKMFTKSRNRQIRDVRYRVDVPAWSVEQRLEAGVPGKSPLHPLKGDKLDLTKAIIPGIHTPYVYESGPAFGATFQLHAEDFRLSSLNHLYKGRKIWIIIPSAAVGLAEEQLGRKESCSQFMRHRAEFVFPEKLNRLGIPFRLIDQSPGETIVILPDAYHEGFSTGYTLAEAKNYAEETWNTETYQPCDASCQLATAIPGEFMRIIEDGEERLDLCSSYSDDSSDTSKRDRDDDDSASEDSVEERPKKKIKWKGGGMSSTVRSVVF